MLPRALASVGSSKGKTCGISAKVACKARSASVCEDVAPQVPKILLEQEDLLSPVHFPGCRLALGMLARSGAWQEQLPSASYLTAEIL